MQDRYVGDVGDFAKYALLRRLGEATDRASVRLGIIWCRYPNEGHNGDGRHVSYLLDPHYSKLDPELHASLYHLVETERAITAISRSKFLPANTVYCDQWASPQFDKPPRPGRNARTRYRSIWLRACLSRTTECDLVFFDPDNGLEVASIPKNHTKAGKYIYWDELIPFWRRGNSLLIYHHLNRTVSAAQQVSALSERFAVELSGSNILPLVFRRGSSRVFWLIHHGNALGRELERRSVRLLNDWSQHFRPFGWPNPDQAMKRTR